MAYTIAVTTAKPSERDSFGKGNIVGVLRPSLPIMLRRAVPWCPTSTFGIPGVLRWLSFKRPYPPRDGAENHHDRELGHYMDPDLVCRRVRCDRIDNAISAASSIAKLTLWTLELCPNRAVFRDDRVLLARQRDLRCIHHARLRFRRFYLYALRFPRIAFP